MATTVRRVLFVVALMLAALSCSDSRREAFIQDKCGRVAPVADAYAKCAEAVGKA